MSQALDMVATPGEGGVDAIVAGSKYALTVVLYMEAYHEVTITVAADPLADEAIQVDVLDGQVTYTSPGETAAEAATNLATAITRARLSRVYSDGSSSAVVATALAGVVTLTAVSYGFDLDVAVAGDWTTTVAEVTSPRRDLSFTNFYCQVVDDAGTLLETWTDAWTTTVPATGELTFELSSSDTLALEWTNGYMALWSLDLSGESERLLVGNVIVIPDHTGTGAIAQFNPGIGP